MSGEADTLIFRAYLPSDLPFLMDSWGSSYFKGTHARKFLSPDQFHAFHRPARERFFSKPNTTVIVCSPESDPNYIIGWIAVEKIPAGLILQYIYVRASCKKEGIASQLIRRAIPTSPVFYTHLTDRAARIMSKKHAQFQRWVMIPHLV